MYADELKQALRGEMYGDGVGMGTYVMGIRWGWGQMGLGWGGNGEKRMGIGWVWGQMERRWGGDGDGVGMGRNLWGWSEYGENKLSLCSSVSDYENDGCCLKLRCANSV